MGIVGAMNAKQKLVLVITIILLASPFVYFYLTPFSHDQDADEHIDMEPIEKEEYEIIKLQEINSFQLEDVRDILVDGNEAWLATGNGLYFYDRPTGSLTRFDTFDGLLSNNTQTLALDDDLLWIGTLAGISIYNRAMGEWYDLSAEGPGSMFIQDIEIDGDNVWVTAPFYPGCVTVPRYGGLYRYTKSNDTWKGYNCSTGVFYSNLIYEIEPDNDNLWIGSADGLFLMNKTEERIYFWSNKNSDWTVPENNRYIYGSYGDGITSLAVFDDQVWAADNSCPDINVHNKTANNWTLFKGEISKTIRINEYGSQVITYEHDIHLDIVIDDNCVYFGTLRGLKWYNKNTMEWQIFDTEEGLINNGVLTMEFFDNQLWVGTYEGVSIIEIVVDVVAC